MNPAAHDDDASHFTAHFESTQMRPSPQSELYLHVHVAPLHGGEETHFPSMHSNPDAPQSAPVAHVFAFGAAPVGGAQKPARQIVPRGHVASPVHVGRQPRSVHVSFDLQIGSFGSAHGVGAAGITGVQP